MRFFVGLLLGLLVLFSAETLNGQDCLKNLERWHRKERYRKIIRKADKIIKKCHQHNEIYFFLAWAEAVEGERKFPKPAGYNHLLRSFRYYERFKGDLSGNRKKGLQIRLLSLAHQYRAHFVAGGDTLASKKLEQIATSVFGNPLVNSNEKNADLRRAIVNEALKHVGKPYRYGGKGPDNFDCSGFTRFVYLSAMNYELPPTSEAQAKIGFPVEFTEALPADLVFFGDPKNGKISHAALIVDVEDEARVKLIHSTNRGVVIESTTEVGWENHWKGKLVQCVNIVDFIEGR